ncbi:hypothetical protein, partial [Kitasatospora purpeofusca]|uniref:hypothetical protein n=1 Tax=Kitasatospora purpeofusca TaxID=67352 RepID=UPI00380B6AF9
GPADPAGLAFYDRLVDALLEACITGERRLSVVVGLSGRENDGCAFGAGADTVPGVREGCCGHY